MGERGMEVKEGREGNRNEAPVAKKRRRGRFSLPTSAKIRFWRRLFFQTHSRACRKRAEMMQKGSPSPLLPPSDYGHSSMTIGHIRTLTVLPDIHGISAAIVVSTKRGCYRLRFILWYFSPTPRQAFRLFRLPLTL